MCMFAVMWPCILMVLSADIVMFVCLYVCMSVCLSICTCRDKHTIVERVRDDVILIHTVSDLPVVGFCYKEHY